MSINQPHAVLNINEAAQLLNVTPSALRLWKRLGRGPAYFLAGKLIRYERAALLAWIKQQTVVRPNRKKTA